VFHQTDLFDSRPQPEPRVFTVTEVNDAVRRLLEDSFGEVVVGGEISNCRPPASGHWYFTLKDDSAQLAAVMFRSDAVALKFQLENGLHVRVFGRLTVYGPGGKYQVVVRSVQPVGQGALELAFRQLKEKLQAEGLFDASRKRSLPRYPRRVALVTSPGGAAVRDMLTTLAARWPLARVRLVPVSVQGDAAPLEIVHALELLNRLDVADVVIVGRGGGSLEDLQAFNDERVARAIAASRLPIVSGVGHEVDFTIADFVADVRAATPTAAAQLVVPHQAEVRTQLADCGTRAGLALRRQLEVRRQKLEALLRSYGMRRPQLLLQEHAQTVDALLERLQRGLDVGLERRRARLDAAAGRLRALSPLAILERGYAYCVDAVSGEMVGRAADTRVGQELRLHFTDGVRPARVQPDAAATEA
jgi:exodeoxyribonuclease VII large subunit